MEVRIFSEAVSRALVHLNRRVLEAYWDLATGGEAPELAAAQAARSRLLRDPDLAGAVGGWVGRVREPVARRRLELLERAVLEARVEGLEEIYALQDSLMALRVAFRPTLEGCEVPDGELATVLRTEPDRRLREAAFRARAEVGRLLGPGIVRLMELRQEAARALGFPGFPQLRFHLEGQDLRQIRSLLDRLERSTRATYQALLERRREALGLDRLEAWDLLFDPEPEAAAWMDAFPADSLVPRCRRTLELLGFGWDTVGIVLDLESRPGKSEQPYCFPVDPPDDVRVVASARPGLEAEAALLHEMGHALHARWVRQEEPLLRTAPSEAFAEGLGEFFGQLVYRREWLEGIAGLGGAALQGILERRAWQRIFELRWTLANVAFELAAYEDPGQDLSRLYWQFLADYLLVPPHPEIPVWAQVPHFITHPVYLQNYLLADLVAAQIRQALGPGPLLRPETGRFLRERLMAPGAFYPTDELLRRTLGAPLDPAPLAAELAQLH
jgi:peptidyl-dipeptidase A